MSTLTVVLISVVSLAAGYAAGVRAGLRRRRAPDQRAPGHRVSSDRRPVVR
jgi:hypothetical protein